MSVFKDIAGQVFGRLTVKGFSHIHKGKAFWVCACECGNEKTIVGTSLRIGISRSCGCLATDFVTNHGLSNTPTYEIWKAMVQRCSNPRNKSFHRYGGRGISVANSWMDYSNFLADMGEKPHGLSIDRIDNDGPYSKDNCRWADPGTQARNTSVNHFIEYDGARLCLADWSKKTGIAIATLSRRLNSGWSAEQALTRSTTRTRNNAGQFLAKAVQP